MHPVDGPDSSDCFNGGVSKRWMGCLSSRFLDGVELLEAALFQPSGEYSHSFAQQTCFVDCGHDLEIYEMSVLLEDSF